MQRMHGWIGRKDREPVALAAVVHRSDGSSSAVQISNLSDQGCRIDGDYGLRIGERLSLTIPSMGDVKAQVRWALPQAAGAQFLIDSDS